MHVFNPRFTFDLLGKQNLASMGCFVISCSLRVTQVLNPIVVSSNAKAQLLCPVESLKQHQKLLYLKFNVGVILYI